MNRKLIISNICLAKSKNNIWRSTNINVKRELRFYSGFKVDIPSTKSYLSNEVDMNDIRRSIEEIVLKSSNVYW